MTFIISAPLRKTDSHGAGHYGASRGNRVHNGIDLCAAPGSYVYPIESGTVTKLGYPYGDDLAFRYVELETEEGLFHRYFYVEPLVDLDDYISFTNYTPLGIAQDLTARYPGITNHFHFEIRRAMPDVGENHWEYIDPTEYLT